MKAATASLLLVCAARVAAYRVIQYPTDHCRGELVDVVMTAGKSNCTNIDWGGSSLFRSDNVHDSSHRVVLYNTRDCEGVPGGILHSQDYCVSSGDRGVEDHGVKSFEVVHHATVIGAHGNTTAALRLAALDKSDEHKFAVDMANPVVVPITPLGVVFVDGDRYHPNGTYEDPDDVLNFFVNNTHQDDRHASLPDNLDERDLIGQICEKLVHCATGRFRPRIVSAVLWANTAYTAFHSVPWKKLANGASWTIDKVSAAITIRGPVATSGVQDSSCDTDYDTGAQLRDGIKTTATDSEDSVVMKFCATDAACFGFALYRYTVTNGVPNADRARCDNNRKINHG